MAAPSLSEITSIKGDGNIAGGSAGAGADAPAPIILPEDQGIKYLHQRAVTKAAVNKYQAEKYQQNIADYMKNLRSIDFSKAHSSDLNGLREDFAKLAGEVGDNFDVISNPYSNQEKFQQLAQQEAQLRGKIEQSSAHNALSAYNKEMIRSNPGWNTKENQELMAKFDAAPMDQRKDFLLKTPHSFNPVEYAQKYVAPFALQEIKKQSKDANWIYTQEGKEYAKGKFAEVFKQGLASTVVNGRPLMEDFDEGYDRLPAEIKKGQTKEQYMDKMIEALIPATSMSSTLSANPYGVQGQSQAFQASESAKSRAFQASQAAISRSWQANEAEKARDFQLEVAEDNGKPKPLNAGEAKARALALTFSPNSSLDEKSGQNIYGDNSKIKKAIYKDLNPGDGEDVKDAIILHRKDKATGEDVEFARIKTGDVEAPRIQYKGSTYDEKTGKVTVHRIDNLTGKPADIIRTPQQAYSDFNRLLGESNAMVMSKGTVEFNKKHFKRDEADVNEYIQHFTAKHPDAPAAESTAAPAAKPKDIQVMDASKYDEFLKKNGLK